MVGFRCWVSLVFGLAVLVLALSAVFFCAWVMALMVLLGLESGAELFWLFRSVW